MTVNSQAVEVAQSVSDQFAQDTASDGLLGLGFDNLNNVKPVQQKTWFSNAKASLASPVFTVYLDENGAGEYEFGAIDSSKYSGQIYYTAVDSSEGHWQFETNTFSIGKAASQTYSSASSAIADTGTSLILLDDDIVTAYYKQVSGAKYSSSQGGYVFSCTTTLPNFGVTIAGHVFTVPGAALNYNQVSSSQCFGGLQSNAGEDVNIFGDVFLRQVFTVFDGSSQPRLGFAQKP